MCVRQSTWFRSNSIMHRADISMGLGDSQRSLADAMHLIRVLLRDSVRRSELVRRSGGHIRRDQVRATSPLAKGCYVGIFGREQRRRRGSLRHYASFHRT